MTVTERVMGAGGWSIQLRSDTPVAVRDQIQIDDRAFSHLIVTKTHVDPIALGDTAMLARARYTGVYRTQKQDSLVLGGCGLAFWLGDEDGKGDIPETAISLTSGSLPSWVTALKPASLSAGTVTDPGGSLTNSFILCSRRDALNSIMATFSTEWRINPNFTLDVGTAAVLYPATPPAVIVRSRGESGREPNITGIEGSVGTERDVEDYATDVLLASQSADGVTDITKASSGATTYKDPQGNAVILKKVVGSYNVDTTATSGVAAAELDRVSEVRQALTLSATTYDIAGDIQVGAPVYVYDPLQNLTDTANEVPYRGRTIHPAISRVLGYTWPVKRGMGVYLRYWDGSAFSWADLTPYVVFEAGSTTVEVGAIPRGDSSPSGASGLGIALTAEGAGLDAEGVRDVIGTALHGSGLISVSVNDGADTITVSTTATANDTDANLKNRANHTGTQTASTISDFTEASQDATGSLLTAGSGISVSYNDAGNALTIAGTAASDTSSGIVELATGAETVALSDATRAVTPAGLSSLVGDTGWVNLTLGSGWSATSGETPAYRVVYGICYLRGRAVTTGTTNTAATLPSGARPTMQVVAVIDNGTNSSPYGDRMRVNTTGDIQQLNPNPGARTNVAFSFPPFPVT